VLNLFSFFNITPKINNIINKTKITDIQFIENEIIKFKNSPARADMIAGELYYQGDHDIIHRKRTIIGEGGKVKTVDNLPNNKIIDNQYSKMVDQKNNYLLSKPITIESEDKNYVNLLNKIFDRKFFKTLKNIGCDSLNAGIGWLYIYYDDFGRIAFKRIKPFEILPFWKDSEHTELDLVVRIYNVNYYENKSEKIIEKAEVYTKNGIKKYVIANNKLIPDEKNTAYIEKGNNKFNWEKIPFIAFKQNSKEIPLIKRVKNLQDALNTIKSDFMNNMQEDARNTILIIKNYDGTDLGEFRKNLAVYGAVKVRYDGETKGGVETLKVDVNSQNYVVICDMLKKAIIENARGFDAKDDRLLNNPNQMNIQSMYADIDIDANGAEAEFQASLQELLWFINVHFQNNGMESFENKKVNFIFNRDILINETEAINNCINSKGILSDESIIAQHPWVTDAFSEYEKVKKDQNVNKENKGVTSYD